MNHKLDITNYHETMLHFQELIGLNVFIQFPVITEQLPTSYEINLENIAVIPLIKMFYETIQIILLKIMKIQLFY